LVVPLDREAVIVEVEFVATADVVMVKLVAA
jgi:hypothetical protein